MTVNKIKNQSTSSPQEIQVRKLSCLMKASIKVVLPWSTCAMTAIFLIFNIVWVLTYFKRRAAINLVIIQPI